ncbi:MULTISPECIES: hypothetical protein [unclassified Haematospirillum]|uniref:hypothetical protein n=1 Tax=unclassified Haematospirillum TaxID=2622088 RepID=UPI00143CBF6A|nr:MULTISPECIES: hypothetical protein [unclassified Haematospirillum]NKD55125.1 hypothetical protein [Haematospirillum sp. H4890]NKD75378.1 hypothetical protein [Haematospirillum sp. H4485]
MFSGSLPQVLCLQVVLCLMLHIPAQAGPKRSCGVFGGVENLRSIALQDGTTIKLDGIDTITDPVTLPYLRTLLDGERICISASPPLPDRHGRLSGDVYRERDDLWVQEQLVLSGLAFVVPTPGAGESARKLLGRESGTRMKDREQWQQAKILKQADTVGQDDQGTFRIVEGIVRRTTRTNKGAYLDFGADWRTDFSVFLPPATTRRLERAGMTLRKLSGRNVQIRGYIEKRAGYLITLTEPDFLQILPSAGLPSLARAVD